MSWEKGKHIGNLVEQSTRLIKLRFGNAFSDHGIDITPEQWIVLDCIHELESSSQKDIVEKTYKDAPTISRILAKLIQKKWLIIRPDVDDKRKSIVRLSDKGKAIYNTCNPIAITVRERLWNGLSKDEYATFIHVIDKIFQNLEKES